MKELIPKRRLGISTDPDKQATSLIAEDPLVNALQREYKDDFNSDCPLLLKIQLKIIIIYSL
jgi:hypothetical protein